MSFLSQIQRPLFCSRPLILSQKRFSIRERIHKYVEPDKFKKHMLAACEPYFKRKYELPEETCKGLPNIKHGLHPLEKYLHDDLLHDIKNTNMLLLLQYNYTKFLNDRVYKNTITKLGCKYHALNNRIYIEAFKNLNYQPDISNLFVTRNSLITGPVESLPNCIKAFRKMPQYILMAGFIDKHLYNVDQLKLMSSATNIDQSRAELVAILSTPTIDLSYYLSKHTENSQSTAKEPKSD